MIRNKARIVARVNHALEKCGLSPTAKEWPVQYENLGRRYVGLALCDKISGSPIVKIDEAYYNPQKPKGAEDIYAHELIHHALPEAMSTAKLERITVNGASQIRTIATRPLMKCKKLF